MISENELLKLRKKYPAGTKVVLSAMDDVQAPPSGTVGTVTFVDDAGGIHVSWETGSSLALIPEADVFYILRAGE